MTTEYFVLSSNLPHTSQTASLPADDLIFYLTEDAEAMGRTVSHPRLTRPTGYLSNTLLLWRTLLLQLYLLKDMASSFPNTPRPPPPNTPLLWLHPEATPIRFLFPGLLPDYSYQGEQWSPTAHPVLSRATLRPSRGLFSIKST